MQLTEPVHSRTRPRPRPRKATAAEVRPVTETLAAAFFADPVIGWAWDNPARRRRILPDFFELWVTGCMEYDEVYVSDDLAGAALWMPPHVQEAFDDEADAFAAAVERVTHEFAPAVLRLLTTLDDHHPREPHCYLPIMGTRPGEQGRGIGSALLDTVLEQCDRNGLPAYLEATSARNQVLYARHGFRGRGEIPLPDGPALRAMWREPRPHH
ncbi:GNAT family N-acetyltransferase [Streptomyces sp. ISL-96]|uniref:GNAT family N-acetyltransferase n=1 Tax=Streptomyces sp. ISL-96 TaxID=2819191 RepID=UPI001BE5537B|nr:GNAT family N-acetyltransferase [Streptomyces sp. ISL-96]MBT2492702.1 GNAT family N-acetyltransferase [Streptomyces sp. ISL-96]